MLENYLVMDKVDPNPTRQNYSLLRRNVCSGWKTSFNVFNLSICKLLTSTVFIYVFITVLSQQIYLGFFLESAPDTGPLRYVVSCTPLEIHHGMCCATSNCFSWQCWEGKKCQINNKNSSSLYLWRDHCAEKVINKITATGSPREFTPPPSRVLQWSCTGAATRPFTRAHYR